MKSNLAICFFLGAMLVGTNTNAQNWTKISLPTSYYLATPYFLNENIGFVFDGEVGELGKLCRTIDGGKDWTSEQFFDSIKVEIKQIYFISLRHGYAATSKGVFETKDTGKTWKSIYPGVFNFSSIYATDTKVFAVGNKDRWYTYGPLIKTENDGNTWDTIYSQAQLYVGFSVMRPNVFGNREDLVFCTYIDKTGLLPIDLAVSKDTGNIWILKSMDMPDVTNTTGMFSFPHCFDLLRTFSHNGGENTNIVGSTDFGDNWEIKTNYFEISSWISGNNCIQYDSDPESNGNNIGDTSVKKQGIWRSENKGIDWVFIPGPKFAEIDDPDFHNLCVVGGGAVVYAGTMAWNDTEIIPLNYLWKTTNGGDGTLSSTILTSSVSMTHDLTPAATICDTSYIGLFYENLSCNYTLLKNISIDGLDSTQFSSQWIHHLACDGLPDTLLIKIFPLYSNGGTFKLRAQFMNDEFQTIDTSFDFTLLQVPGNIEAVYTKRFSLSGNAGDTVNILTYINSPQIPAEPRGGSVELKYGLNTSLLTPFAFVPINGVTADPVQTTKTTATVTLHFDPGFAFSGETVLGRLRCVAYLTDTLETDITLTGATHSSGCLATLTDSNVTHFTLIGCGAPALSNFIKYGKAYDILSIVPNPARNFIQVLLKNNGIPLHYELLDALGARQKDGMTSNNSLQINLLGLSSGNYYFRLSGEGQAPITKSLVIAK